MASREFIEKRIAGAEAKIEKLNKKMERILKAKATDWEVNPYYYHEDDIKWTQRDIDEATQSLEKYRAELQITMEKDASRNVKVILEFLEGWKTRVRAYYMEAMVEEKEAWAEVSKAEKVMRETAWGTPEREEAEKQYKALYDEYKVNRYGVYEEQEVPYYNYRGELKGHHKEQVKVADGKWEYASQYLDRWHFEEAVARLDKDLKEEANRKYDFVIERTNAIVGQITDASNLRIGAKGDLNGFILGTKGKAKVQTIGAGGYNIQCFHFRTLINRI